MSFFIMFKLYKTKYPRKCSIFWKQPLICQLQKCILFNIIVSWVKLAETLKHQKVSLVKKSTLPTNATTHSTISTYKQISQIYFKDTWEMVYCNCVQGLKILCLYIFKYLHTHTDLLPACNVTYKCHNFKSKTAQYLHLYIQGGNVCRRLLQIPFQVGSGMTSVEL